MDASRITLVVDSGVLGNETKNRASSLLPKRKGLGAPLVLQAPGVNGHADMGHVVRQLLKYKRDIEALVVVLQAGPAATLIKELRAGGLDCPIAFISALDSQALAHQLMDMGPRFIKNIIVSQVVPHYDSSALGVRAYRQALATYFPDEAADFVSLEGYVVASLMIEVLGQATQHLDEKHVVPLIEAMDHIDLGLGVPLGFSRMNHQASHSVWGTTLGLNGQYTPLELGIKK